jgi:hypothetical protein
MLIILLLLIHSTLIISTKIHHCQVESYTETVYIRDCLNGPVQIETTRCRGQCQSHDKLVYDWKYAPTHYRHDHHLDCCSPIDTIPHEIQILCENKQRRTIKYRIVKRCDCRSCNDKCSE